ncbi:NAD(+) diphosphatase [Geobacter sp. SVR]|uniref:NAD(+) diphosphatase n=1 Tax=Geobacter sp. SVR TaxID=2495594 RepID=UPI00143EFAD5|nr:NAD(+) diphosphatase [Geobacter sp. SVR]BCS53160.1 NADH pyrophosphatase [Geobacter sp. SVR]GCF84545.1 NADH pyrophosphatase [Geobacter sp. SVR]
MPYPEQINLPFNYSSIRSEFQPCTPLPQQPREPGYWAIIRGGGIIVQEQPGGAPSLPEGELPSWLESDQAPLYIGLWRGKPLRGFTVSSSLELQAPLTAEAFNASENRLDISTLTISGLAKQILHWESNGRHCSRCGAETDNISGTWGRRCRECGAEHYPHIHPCAIVLVKRGNQVLLTRKAEWPAGRYSLVAGFLDFGESLEECALREIREETGIIAENIRYVGSQNWPFPAQLMAGFVADYAGGDIQVDKNELEDARWFPVDALPILPPSRSIARWIIDTFAR